MRIRLTDRRVAVLTAIHQQGEVPPSGICHATGFGPGVVYQTLGLFVGVGWVGYRPHPSRQGVSLYHLTDRGKAAVSS